MRRLLPVLLLGCLAAASGLPASAQGPQPPYPTKFTPEIAARPDVKQALAYIDANFAAEVEEWVHLTEIPGLSGHEQKRAEYIKAELVKIGLTPQTDEIGNVWAVRKGTGGGPSVVFAAHMDTVQPLDANLKVRREDNGTMHAPGITDDTAALPAQLQALRAMREAKIETKGDLVFLFTVQEEVGLKGMYYWAERNRAITNMLVAVDGGLGPVSYGALGIYWSRMKFSAEGAHTLSSRDKPNPVRAAATCINDIYTVELPPATDPVPAIYNVGGLMTAGNVVNAIPQEVTFSVDLRTVDPVILKRLDTEIMAKCEAAAAGQKVTFTREFIQRSEAGGRPEHLADRRAHPVVQSAIDVLKFLDVSMPASREAVASGATDGNVGVLLGIPTVSIGAANGGGGHTLKEWARIDSLKTGTQQVLLLAVSLAELAVR